MLCAFGGYGAIAKPIRGASATMVRNLKLSSFAVKPDALVTENGRLPVESFASLDV
jgi:hypothetical protein